jgi:hypothetical protein
VAAVALSIHRSAGVNFDREGMERGYFSALYPPSPKSSMKRTQVEGQEHQEWVILRRPSSSFLCKRSILQIHRRLDRLVRSGVVDRLVRSEVVDFGYD